MSTTDIRLDILFKKAFGLADAFPNQSLTLENVTNRPAVYPSLQIYQQSIPSVAPTDINVVSFTSINGTATVGDVSTKKEVSTSNTHIVKYTNLTLRDATGSSNKKVSYYYNSTNNLLQYSIPNGYDPATNSYNVTVYNKNGVVVASNDTTDPWVLDPDSGVITFTSTSSSYYFTEGPPIITFWRYEGAFGFPSTGLTVSEYSSLSSTAGISVSGINTIKFDTDSGFAVIDEDSGTVMVGMNSTFKYWNVEGQATGNLIANGLDTITFSPGDHISISTSDPNGNKTLSIETKFTDDTSMNARLFVNGDVSMNSRLSVLLDVSMNSGLFVKNKVSIGVESSNYNLDVSGETNLRGVLNPVTLVDNSVLLTNSLPLDFSNNIINLYKKLQGSWHSTCVSANGKYQVATRYSGSYIYNSDDYGNTWHPFLMPDSNEWGPISMSSDGKYRTIVTANVGNSNQNYIYTSYDYGVTWTQRFNIGTSFYNDKYELYNDYYGHVSYVYVSANGKYQISALTGTYVYISNDYGKTWTNTQINNNKKHLIGSVSVCGTGQYQLVAILASITPGGTFANGNFTGTIDTADNYLYLSNDYGNTWNIVTKNSIFSSKANNYFDWSGTAISANGRYITVCIKDPNLLLLLNNLQYFFFTSSDYGKTWELSTNVNPLGNNGAVSPFFTCISMSADGQYQIASANLTWCSYFTSHDYGKTWFMRPGDPNYPNSYDLYSFNSVSISANAQYLCIAGYDYLYTYTTPYANLSVSALSNFGGDVSMNSDLSVSGDVSLNSGLYAAGKTVLKGDVSMNSDLSVSGDVSLNSGLYTAGKTVLDGDVSMNSNIFIGSDITLQGRIFVGDSLFKSGNDFSNDLSSNSRLFVSGDVSMGNRLFVSGDVSLNSGLVVSNDVSLNSGLVVSNDVSLNSNLFVGKDLNITGRLNVQQYSQSSIIYTNVTTTDYTLIIAEDISLNGTLNVNYDVSLNSRLFVSGNTYIGGNIVLPAGSSVLIGGSAVGANTTTTTTTSDTWTLSNLIYAPPAIILSVVASTQSITIKWDYPTQINTGFYEFPLPYLKIFNFNYTFSYTSGTRSIANQTANGTSYVSSVPSNTNGTAITAIVLTKNATATTGGTTTTFGTSTFQSSIKVLTEGTAPNTTTRYALTCFDTNLSSFTSATNSAIRIWYSNWSISTSASLSTAALITFSDSGVPSIVRSLSTSTSNNTNVISFTFSYIAPELYDSTSGATIAVSTEQPIEFYKITYSSVASPTRYGTSVSDTGSPAPQTALSYQITTAYPDSLYTFSVSAKNSLSTTYGETATKTGYSTSINPKQTFGSIGFIYPNSTTSAKMVSTNNNTVTYNIYFGSVSTSDWTSNSFASPIHKLDNRGSSANSLLTISAGLGGNSASVIYNGFSTPLTAPTATNSENLVINPSMPTDSYSTASYQGFYLQTSNTVTIKANALVASNNVYTITITQTQAGTSVGGSNVSFYVDTYGTPAVTSIATSIWPDTTAAVQICGIYVFNGSVKLNSTTTATSIGNYFYNSSNILTYGGPQISGSEQNNNLNNVSSDKSSGQLTGTITITNSSGRITYSTSSYSTAISGVTPIAYNQVGTASTSNPTSSAIPAIIDPLSVTLYNSINSNQTLINILIDGTTSTGINGKRVYSGGAPLTGSKVPSNLYGGTTPYYTIPYNNSWDLTNNDNSGYDAKYELLIANGKFRTRDSTYAQNYATFNYGTGSAIAQNTVDYYGLQSETGYRYVTFAWSILSSSATNLAYLNVLLTDLTTFNQSTLLYAGDSTTQILIYYRMEDSTNSSTLELSGSAVNTWWISLNDNASNENIEGAHTPSNYKVKPNSNKAYHPGTLNINLSGTTATIKALMPTGLNNAYSAVSAGKLICYIRIGLPMSISSCSIGNVKAYLSKN
jgi:hypothetical protein